jgi:hypothetical protein
MRPRPGFPPVDEANGPIAMRRQVNGGNWSLRCSFNLDAQAGRQLYAVDRFSVERSHS